MEFARFPGIVLYCRCFLRLVTPTASSALCIALRNSPSRSRPLRPAMGFP
jgi:hypothetical protein